MNKAWRDRILRLSISGIELCALYTVSSLVNFRAANSALSVVGILIIYIISLGFNRLFFNRKLTGLVLYSLNMLFWIASFQLVIKLQLFTDASIADPAFLTAVPRAIAGYTDGFRPELVIFFTSILLWLMGYRLARARVGFVVSLAEFQCGLAVILFIYTVNAQINAAALNSPLVALTFVALSLIALAISHAEQDSSWLSSRHSIYWFILLVLSIVLIVVFGFAAGTLLSHDLLDILLTPLRWFWWLLTKFMLFLAEHTVMERFLSPLEWGGAGGTGAEDPELLFKSLQIPPWLRDGLRFALGIFWLTFILVALWRSSSFFVRWLRSHFVGRSQAEVESLNGAFKDDLLYLLWCTWNWVKGLFRKDTGACAAPEIESVRQLYREVLSWGAAKGVRRSSEQTPYEYLYALSEVVPLAAIDLRLITDGYVSTRYGSIPPDKDELTELRAIWQRIKRKRNSHK
jgi:hypothetical protein